MSPCSKIFILNKYWVRNHRDKWVLGAQYSAGAVQNMNIKSEKHTWLSEYERLYLLKAESIIKKKITTATTERLRVFVTENMVLGEPKMSLEVQDGMETQSFLSKANLSRGLF